MVKEHPLTGTRASDDALVLFEVLSPSNDKADQNWRRKVYASVPNCQHYVTVSLNAVDVTVYDRANRWKGRSITSLAESLALAALGVSMPLPSTAGRRPRCKRAGTLDKRHGSSRGRSGEGWRSRMATA